MGVSPSKRVQNYLRSTPDFRAACAAVYADCLSRSQHAFPGVRPYQLVSATEHLHRILSPSLRLISKWLPRPPDRAHVDRALKAVLSRRSDREAETTLDEEEFMEFAIEVFAEGVISGARMEVLKMVPLGASGIAGVGAVVRSGKEVVAAVIGAYAVGVATSVYLSLDG